MFLDNPTDWNTAMSVVVATRFREPLLQNGKQNGKRPTETVMSSRVETLTALDHLNLSLSGEW